MKLQQTKQCKTCPWIEGNSVKDIPNYDPNQHLALENTIASDLSFGGQSVNCMACHHSKEGKENMCIGWLNNQLGVGNNIPLRLMMMNYENASDIEVVGDQRDNFEDTFK